MKNNLFPNYPKNWQRVTNQILWEKRKIYIDLLEQYFSSKIDAEDVVDKFFALYRNHNNEINEILLDPERLKKIQMTSKSEGFSDLILDIFNTCEPFDVEETNDNSAYPISENRLRNELRLRLQELKEYD